MSDIRLASISSETKMMSSRNSPSRHRSAESKHSTNNNNNELNSSMHQDDEEESIYKLIPPPVPVVEKQPLYRSKYAGDAPVTGSTLVGVTSNFSGTSALNNNSTHNSTKKQQVASTLGPAQSLAPNPRQFLKKKTKHATLPSPTKFAYDGDRKPAVVKREEQPALKRNQHNFIEENAVAAIVATNKTMYNEEKSALEREDYGQVPSYLQEVKKTVEQEKEYLRKLIESEKEEENKNKTKTRIMPEEERQQLLTALKAKWEEINHEYQGITHMVALDTLTKIRRKEQFESQLQQLEKSIDKLSKKVVYIHDE